MNLMQIITSNIYINATVTAWFIAQLIKVLLVFYVEKKFDLSRFMGSGGMPSSHSASVCALMVSVARGMGITSAVFALCFVFAVIVMHDAAGVRRAAGQQAAVLNKIMESWQTADGELFEKQLKELIGHTPLQVFLGAVLGVIVGGSMPM